MSSSAIELRASKSPDPCVFVIFGATGDLTSRKLLPALYNLAREGLLPTNFACVGFARRDKSNETFRQEMKQAINNFSRVKPVNETIWERFDKQIFYHRSEFDDENGYKSLKELLDRLDKEFGTKGNRLFYLSTPPSYFPDIVQKLYKNGLIYNVNEIKDKWSRIIIEKPFGHDLQSGINLQKELTTYLDESQIYRIDHYLGKETVQNLLVFRFGNPIFEFQWNNHHIDNVQMTVAEEIGIGTRGKFFEEAGILRDIVQNHMMQLLSIITMEPPTNICADAIHDEKVKVLQSIRPINSNEMPKFVVRGQYGAGIIEGEEVLGYRQEENVNPLSNVETYAAIKLYIDNWRWAGVPFYLRAGKRLPKRVTEIAVTFKRAPGFVFEQTGRKIAPNMIVIRIQPDEGISLRINCKVPATNGALQPVKMDFKYGAYFGAAAPEAYERLICDCMAGDSTLFARGDEVLSSWKFIDAILEYWKSVPPSDFPNYPSGSWGPIEAERLLQRDGHEWRDI